jgi:hypothetical protein
LVRKIDEKKTRRALRRLERARKAAVDSGADTPDLSEWEGEFLGSLEERLEKFGSAFNDPDKGNTDDALSARQALKLREIEKKAKGKARKPMSRGNGFKRKDSRPNPRSRDIHDDIETPDETPDTPPPHASRLAAAPEARRTGFRVIEGGAADGED